MNSVSPVISAFVCVSPIGVAAVADTTWSFCYTEEQFNWSPERKHFRK